MPILNMNYGANKGGANIGEPSDLSVTATSDSATITWTDNDLNTIPPSAFFKSVLVRKVGSAPTSPSDGTLVVTETVKNTYSSNGYIDTGLTEGTTYYYQVFSYSDLGGITYGTPVSVTPQGGWQPGVNTLAYWKFNNNLNDETGNMTATGSNITYGAIGNNHYVENTATGFYPVITVTGNGLAEIGAGDWTVSLFQYVPNTSSNQAYLFGEWYDGVSPRPGITLRFRGSSSCFSIEVENETMGDSSNIQKNNWYHVVATRINGVVYLYVNGQLAITPFANTRDLSSGSGHVFYMMGRAGWIDGTWNVTGAKTSEVIYEKQGWTAQEILDYFNQNKANYGIS